MKNDPTIITGGRRIGFSKTVLSKSPEIRAYFGLGGVESSQPKPTPAQALDSCQPKHQHGSRCVVTLIACVRRQLDGDNLQGALKPLRDAISESIGIDDGDPRIQWQYGQIETRGEQGVEVKIEML